MPMPPKLNRKRALFVLTKIDEILAWEKQKEAERDTRFVELGRYLCEVRAGQYWRLENLKSFDEFLARRFPESRRKAYYLMSIHEHLPPQARKDLKEVGWTKGLELAKLARRDGQHFDCATWHCVTDNLTQWCKTLSTTSSALARLLQRPGVLGGRFLPSPHIIGRLLHCAALCLVFPISSISRTRALLRLSASRWITSTH
jgi:hypothetical protein